MEWWHHKALFFLHTAHIIHVYILFLHNTFTGIWYTSLSTWCYMYMYNRKLITDTYMYMYMCVRVFDKLIHVWCTQRASYLVLHSSLFESDGAVNYDCIVTYSINSLLIGSRCISNGTHTRDCCANSAHASKHIKKSDVHVHVCVHCQHSTVYRIQ